MEQAEIEILVNELETRVDRLRSLYDQYFMGIERLEPLVPRKDVDRRLAALRKEQIRNTGLRFKFQMIIQRYNTYQTHWIRISRQIENGTYKRDVVRATKRFGFDPTKERPLDGEAEAPATRATREDDAGRGERIPSSAPVIYIPSQPAEEIYELDASPMEAGGDLEDDPFGQISQSVPTAAGRPAPTAGRVPPERFASAARFELDDLADPFEEADPFPRPSAGGTSPSVPKLRIAPRAGGPLAPDARDTERRIPVSGPARPSLRAASVPGGEMSPATTPGIGRDTEPRILVAKRASIPDELERATQGAPSARPPLARPGAPPTSVDNPTIRRPGTLPSAIKPPGAPPSQPKASVPSPAPPTTSPADAAPRRPETLPSAQAGVMTSRMSPAAPTAAAAPPTASPDVNPRRPATLPSAGAPGVRVPPGSQPGSAQAGGAPAASAPAASPRQPPPVPSRPISPAAQSTAAPRGPAQPASSAAPSRAAVSAPATIANSRPNPAPPPTPPVGDLSNDRFREIYSQYVETRKKHNEPTGAITHDALAKQLADSTSRLKQKHGAKAIDFEVVVKDGKTILRPVVK